MVSNIDNNAVSNNFGSISVISSAIIANCQIWNPFYKINWVCIYVV